MRAWLVKGFPQWLSGKEPACLHRRRSLSSWICLFWVCHRSGIIQYVACCVWLLSFNRMLSRSCHVEHSSVFHSFLWLNSPLYGYTTFSFIQMLVDIWAVLSFGHYAECCYQHLSARLHTRPQFLWVCP